MEEPSEITVYSVVRFLENNGGRCTNQELVSHFKKLLNDPFRKVDFRLQFKDIVNTIASVHEDHGLKYICLKKQYYGISDDGSSSSEQVKVNENQKHQQNYQPYWRYRLSFNTNLMPPSPLPATVLTRTTSSEEPNSIPSLHQGVRRKSLQDLDPKKNSCYEGYTSQTRNRSKSLYQIPSVTSTRTPHYVQRRSISRGEENPFINNAVLKDASPGCQSLPDNRNLYNVLKHPNSHFSHESSGGLHCNSAGNKSPSRRPTPVCFSDENIDSLLSIIPDDEVFGDATHPPIASSQRGNHDSTTSAVSPFREAVSNGKGDIPRNCNIYNNSPEMPKKPEFEQKEMPLKANAEWEKLQLRSCNAREPQLEEICVRSVAEANPNADVRLHSDSNTVKPQHLQYSSSVNGEPKTPFESDVPKLKPENAYLQSNGVSNSNLEGTHLHSNDVADRNLQNACSHAENGINLSPDGISLPSGSVRERAQMIDTIAAATSTSAVPVEVSPRKSSPRTTRNHRTEKVIPEDNASIVSLDSKLRRQWFVKAAKADYHGLVGLLKKEPRLAGIRDIASGFTALHWAAKQGNAEVVKLIAGTHRVSPNLKSNGGYTCIHLATLYKHKTIVNLLLKTYGANPTIRDNSGKRADQYPENYVSFTVGIIRKPPRPAAVTAASSSSLDRKNDKLSNKPVHDAKGRLRRRVTCRHTLPQSLARNPCNLVKATEVWKSD